MPQELEDQNRRLDAEVGELRELRDQEALSGDVKELELELKVRGEWMKTQASACQLATADCVAPSTLQF